MSYSPGSTNLDGLPRFLQARYWAVFIVCMLWPFTGFSQATITTFAGGGPPVVFSGSALNTAIGRPVAVVSDASGGFYAASSSQVFRVRGDGSIVLIGDRTTIPNFASDIRGLALDNQGNLYIANLDRIFKLDLNGTSSIVAGDPSAGRGDGGPATAASLFEVSGVAVGTDGTMFIAEFNDVRKVSAGGTITTLDGSAPAVYQSIQAITLDASGNLYVAEQARVRKFGMDGTITVVTGDGISGHTGDGGPATAAEVNNVNGLAVDIQGNLYLDEYSGCTVRKITSDGIIRTIAGTGICGGGGDGGPAILAQFASPGDIDVDAQGNLYIADTSNYQIREITTDQEIKSVAGFIGTPGDGLLATDVPLINPTGVAVDGSDNVYIADAEGARVRKVDARTGVISTLAGRTSNGSAQIEFKYPFAVAVDRSGNVYVTETQANKVQRIRPDGFRGPFAGNGIQGYAGEGGPAIDANLIYPDEVESDAAGNIWISQEGLGSLKKITPDGLLHTLTSGGPSILAPAADGGLFVADYRSSTVSKYGVAGEKTLIAGRAFVPGYSGDGGPAINAQLNGPTGLAVDAAGNLFIAESGNHTVRKVSPDGIITTVVGNGTAGDEGDGGDPASAKLRNPGALAIDSDGNLYIADRENGKVRKVSGIASANHRTFSMSGAGGVSWTSSGARSSSPAVGYGRIQPTGSEGQSGLAIIGFRRNGILVSETAVPASRPLNSGRIFAEIIGGVNTGFAITNPNNSAIIISYYLTGPSGDTATQTFSMAANAQISAFLTEAPFNVMSPFIGTFTFSSSQPIAVTALRGLTNERGEFLMTTLPVADLTVAPQSSPLMFSQFAAGGGWSTEISLINSTDTELSGSIQFFASNGSAEPVTIDGNTNNIFPYSIPPHGGVRWKVSGSSQIQTGSVHVIPAGAAPVGLCVLSFEKDGVTVTETGVAASKPRSAFHFYAESSGPGGTSVTTETGIAISNSSNQTASVTLELYNLDGSPTGRIGQLEILPNGQRAAFLNEFAGLGNEPFQGVLRISSTAPISAAGLRGRYNERGDFLVVTTPPIHEGATSADGALFFPLFADSGGYTTQFIIFNESPDTPSTATLLLFSQSGEFLVLGN